MGDLVRPHPKRSDLITVGDGIVIGSIDQATRIGETTAQDCVVMFAPREVDLWVECRKWAREHFCNKKERPDGIVVCNADLTYLGRSHPEWLEPPTDEEIELSRFSDILG